MLASDASTDGSEPADNDASDVPTFTEPVTRLVPESWVSTSSSTFKPVVDVVVIEAV